MERATFREGELQVGLGARLAIPRTDRIPAVVVPGLAFLGGRIDTAPYLGRELPLVRTWFEATGVERADVVIQHDYLDDRGKLIKSRRHRPLLGLYPTNRWAEGEVVEDLRMMRFRKPPRYVRVVLRVLKDDKVVFGPEPLGRLIPDQHTGKRGR